MRRSFPFRSLLLFTVLRLESLVLVPSPVTFYTNIRSLSLAARNWTTGVAKANFALTIPIQTPQLSQIRNAKMSSSADAKEQEVLDRLAEPASKQTEILGTNEGREDALKEVKKEEEKVEKKEEKKEDALPKLSAADFRVYNSMAEHMNYYVRFFIMIFYSSLLNLLLTDS